METIYYTLAALATIAILMTIVGLKRPALVVRWGEKRTRGRVLLYYGIGAVVLSSLSQAVMPDEVRLEPVRERLERARREYESQDYQDAIRLAEGAIRELNEKKVEGSIDGAALLANQAQAFLDSAKAAEKEGGFVGEYSVGSCGVG